MQRINEQKVYSNYKRNIKFLGIIDYQSLIFIVVYILVIITLLRLLPFSLEVIIYIFMFCVIPVVAVFCININNESTIDVLLIILKHLINRKVFVKLEYSKEYKPCIYK